ncbi:5127_t:CDS:1, partial [Dentiscutata erythropus]
GAIQKEKIPFNQCCKFENVNLISRNVYKATFKNVLKFISLNDKFTLDNLINEVRLKYFSIIEFARNVFIFKSNNVKSQRKLEIHDRILKLYGIIKH